MKYSFLAIGAISLACGLAAGDFPSDFAQWACERVGPVVFPEGSSHSWEELTALATDLGAKAVKTWIGADKPGDALNKIKTEPYRELIRRFEVVHFNVSPGYIVSNYQSGKIDPEMLNAVRDEWRDITRFLCAERRSPDQIFLLSVGGELNVYVGTEKAYPEFPVSEYVNACHEGKETALAECKDKGLQPLVYSVAEIQGDIEYDRFAKQWAPEFRTDLVSLSYYTFYRPLDDALAVLQSCVKPRGPFGPNRLMMGEYGPSLESCNWNQVEHLRWHNDILRAAFNQRLQFAFFYEIADHEFVIKTGSHDGLVTWAPGAVHRLAWQYYYGLYHGRETTVPTFDLYELPQRESATTPNGQPANLVVQELRSEAKLGEKASFTAVVANTGNALSNDTGVNFYVDDRLIAWVWLPSVAPGQTAEVKSNQGDARFVWNAQAGTHRATAIVDLLRKNGGSSRETSTKTLAVEIK